MRVLATGSSDRTRVCDEVGSAPGQVADRWVMTSTLAGVGMCHLVTALGLRPARPAGRAVLATGGAATLALAAFPLRAAGGWHRIVPTPGSAG